MNKQRHTLTESTLATIYGCCGLFDICSDDDLMSLTFEGQSKFLDWLGWERTDLCEITKNFITFARPEQTGGNPSAGWLADPCADANGVEWGTCDFNLTDFARLRRAAPTRDLTKTGLRLCEKQPRYRLDKSRIDNDREYDMVIATEVLMQDLKRLVVNGNRLVAGQADGLQRLVRFGYTSTSGRRCTSMDSIVIDWNSNNMDGVGGAAVPTWNGTNFTGVYDFISTLLAVFREIRQRMSYAPAVDANRMRTGDMVLVAPTQLLRCILDAYTCWSVCPGAQYEEANLDTFDARQFRISLNGGMFGDGEIALDGFSIPLIAYEWEMISGPTTFDAYLLTGQVGNLNVLHGQYNDLSIPASLRPDYYMSSDAGKLLTWSNDDNTCEERSVEMQPRILCWAPWMQARFQNVVCRQANPLPISPDPNETSFFPESSFSVAACP